MPKKNAKAQKFNELDEAEFFTIVSLIEKEKGIPKTYMLEKVIQVLVSAYKWDRESAGDNMTVEADEEVGIVRMFVKEDAVEKVSNSYTKMSFQMAWEKLPYAQSGDVARIEVHTHGFGRTAVQTARQVITQGMREAERRMTYDEFSSKEHEILTSVVIRVDSCSGMASLRISSGSEATEAFLAPGEQVKDEMYPERMRLRAHVVEVRRSIKEPQVLISYTYPDLIRRPFELEVPEIYGGIVEVKSIARKTGSCTRLTVWSVDPDVDPIGACMGSRGQRVSSIMEGLKGEEVDIIEQSEEPAKYTATVLSPADVASVAAQRKGKACRVVVPDDRFSPTIDREGQNVQLAVKLTGWKIDIKPMSTPIDEEPEDEEDVLLDDEAETGE